MPNPFMRPMSGKNPEFYAMSCPKCGWKESFELDQCGMTEIRLPGTPPDNWRHVTELPKRCPKCDARLNGTRLPVVIRS